MRLINILFFCAFWFVPQWAVAQLETVDVPITADNSIIDVGVEHDFNMGTASSIRLKSFQHHLILNFDTEQLQGWSVRSARLRYSKGNESFPRVSISTIQGPWAEGDSSGFGISEGGSTFNNAQHPDTPWAWPGSHFPDVVHLQFQTF